MTHSPPVPPGNQSPFPIEEPPHRHPAPLPPVAAKKTARPSSSPSTGLVLGAAAAIAAVGLGVAATLFARRPEKKAPTKRRARKRKA